MNYSSIRKLLSTLLCFLFIITGLSAAAQNKSDSIINKNVLRTNSQKLELIYKSYTSTTYTTTNGVGTFNTRTYSIPYLRVNGGDLERIDRKANLLRDYFEYCPAANNEIDLMLKERKKANLYLIPTFTAGAAIAISGVISGTNKEGESGRKTFWTRVGIGTGVMLTGAVLGYGHVKKAKEHFRMSFDLYDQQCYINQAKLNAMKDSSKSAAGRDSASAKLKPSPPKFENDVVKYELIRNEPENSGIYGLAIDPLQLDVHAMNISMNAALSLVYTYRSIFNIEAGYKIGWWDNMAGYPGNYINILNGATAGYGEPANYKRSNSLFAQSSISLLSWQKDGYYSQHLGFKKIERYTAEVVGSAEGSYQKTLNLRAGYSQNNQLIQTDNTIPYVYALKDSTFEYNGQTYPLNDGNMPSSPTTIQFGMLSAGIGIVKYGDMKIELKDDEYGGTRESRSRTEYYIDVLYAPRINVGDVLYNFDTEASAGDFGAPAISQVIDVSNTPVRQLGFRAGVSTLSLSEKLIGFKTGFELGVRPGVNNGSMSENAYLMLKVGFIFGGKKKDYE